MKILSMNLLSGSTDIALAIRKQSWILNLISKRIKKTKKWLKKMKKCHKKNSTYHTKKNFNMTNKSNKLTWEGRIIQTPTISIQTLTMLKNYLIKKMINKINLITRLKTIIIIMLIISIQMTIIKIIKFIMIFYLNKIINKTWLKIVIQIQLTFIITISQLNKLPRNYLNKINWIIFKINKQYNNSSKWLMNKLILKSPYHKSMISLFLWLKKILLHHQISHN